eukprot:TRINITY_DN12927_c0_g1_i1.p1 TRINITY_DN12927_c0_g1~~TRINITY_DN12927_c0_g1_i1.p1  ORF type:complete len:218 (-),score=11.63 TRINITY_DN12927_c0_g1_i1:121-774(-)
MSWWDVRRSHCFPEQVHTMPRSTNLIHSVASQGQAGLHTLMEVLERQKPKSLDMKDSNGQSALHLAALSGCAQGCEVLIRHGAHIYVKNSSGETALHIATRANFVDCVKTLLRFGSQGLIPDGQGQTSHDLIRSGAMYDVFDTHYRETRKNPAMLQNLERVCGVMKLSWEKAALQEEFDEILNIHEPYESFEYKENRASECRPPEPLFRSYFPRLSA